IEPGVMPMASQDAILDRPAIKRETHMRAAVVEGADPALVADHEHWPMAVAPQHHAALGLQFRKRAHAKELAGILTHSCPIPWPISPSAAAARFASSGMASGHLARGSVAARRLAGRHEEVDCLAV